MSTFKIDQYELELAAKAVMYMNDSVSERYSSVEEFQNFIESMAYQYMQNNTNFSTSGFVLTAYDDFNGNRVVRISVSAYVALKYAQSKEESSTQNVL